MVDVDFIEGLKHFYHPDTRERKALLLASSDGTKVNVMPFTSWSISLSETGGWRISVYVFTKHFTHELIKLTGQFTVSAPGEGWDDILECCGKVSGRDHDKFERCGLTSIAARYVKAPLIKECLGGFECETRKTYPFWMTFPGQDKKPIKMTIFEGNVLAAHVSEDLMQKS